MAEDSPESEIPEGDERTRSYSANAIHMVRTVTGVNLALSRMADQKASILMGANFVVFTISVGQAGRGELPLTLAVLALFAFASALCAIAALMPSVSGRPLPEADENLLFFGVFATMGEREFTGRVLESLTEDERILRAMLRDIHQNGLVLSRKKYRYLRYAYWLFLAGLTMTFIAFLFERGGMALPTT